MFSKPTGLGGGAQYPPPITSESSVFLLTLYILLSPYWGKLCEAFSFCLYYSYHTIYGMCRWTYSIWKKSRDMKLAKPREVFFELSMYNKLWAPGPYTLL